MDDIHQIPGFLPSMEGMVKVRYRESGIFTGTRTIYKSKLKDECINCNIETDRVIN